MGQAIQERIRELDFQDCKVRVSNVDSQASFENIVIQVIGETSNKSAELKKFVQTFVLAQQPTGYFVLNDIFRYINEEGEEEPADAGGSHDESAAGPLMEDVEMPKAQPAAEELSAVTLDETKVDKELVDTIETEPAAADAPVTNGISEAVAEAEAAPIAGAETEEPVVAPVVAEKAVQEEKQPETPAEPAPTPSSASRPSSSKPAAPAQQAAPAKPLTWASRAAAAAGPPKPAVPVVAPKTSTPPAQARAPPAAQPAKPAPSQAAPAPAAAEKDKENNGPSGGWQNVGSDHTKRQNRPQSISAPIEKEGTMGYVRNVTEKVPTEDLRTALSSFGQLIYFDINRSKASSYQPSFNLLHANGQSRTVLLLNMLLLKDIKPLLLQTPTE